MTNPTATNDTKCEATAEGFFLRITVANLRKALNAVACSSSYLPILNMVKFDGATITGTDCDVRVTADMEVIEVRGKALAPRSELSSLADNLRPETIITFKSHAKGIEADIDGGSYILPNCDLADFPEFPFVASHYYDNLPKQFTKAIRFALGSVSHDDARFYLQGVCIHKDHEGAFLAVGSNGHILSAHPLGIDLPDLFGSIIPTEIARRICSLPVPQRIEISEDKKLAFYYSGLTIHARLIDAPYPDWTRLPHRITEAHKAVTVERKPYLKRLLRMNAVIKTSEDNTHIWLTSQPNALELTGTNREGFEATEILAVSAGSADLSCKPRYNAHYLIHLAHSTQGQTITINIPNDFEAAIIHGEGDGFHLLMPVNPKKAKEDRKKKQQREAGKGGA
ncbi:DNA polymerase III subunit beta [Brucella anthropi]|uniref:DNA polymerase III subunit beta n=1 Tax=Brucella anthropi TaxID=529 RepID=UPI00178C5D3C|nr:DNA polymerase III subunit beta [Brucella anthropi]